MESILPLAAAFQDARGLEACDSDGSLGSIGRARILLEFWLRRLNRGSWASAWLQVDPGTRGGRATTMMRAVCSRSDDSQRLNSICNTSALTSELSSYTARGQGRPSTTSTLANRAGRQKRRQSSRHDCLYSCGTSGGWAPWSRIMRQHVWTASRRTGC